MKKFPKPWYRPSRGVWYVTIDGQQINLGPDEVAARQRYHELMAQPRLVEAPSGHFSVIADRFLEWVQNNRSPETYEWYRYRIQRFVDLHPQMAASELRPHHVDTWADSYKLSVTSKRNYLRSIKRCMKWAKKQGYIDSNPIEDLEVPAAEAKEAYVTTEEFDALYESFKTPEVRDLLMVTWLTGCRPQESLRVEARHVDVANQRWVFPKSESKGKKVARIVYQNDEAMVIVRRLMLKNPDGPLFRNSQGRPWTTDAINSRFYYYQQKTGKRFSLYAMRHTWATNALRKGLDSLSVALLMGHQSPETLVKVYQHLSLDPKHLLDQARKAAG